MTPKEKAEELVAKFSPILPFYSVMDNLNKSKQCALIAVDEVLNYIERINNAFNLNLSDTDWNEVRKEIEKL